MNGVMAKKEPANPWPKRLKGWQERLEKSNDEMAALLDIPSRTWIAWKYGERQPSRVAKTLIQMLIDKD